MIKTRCSGYKGHWECEDDYPDHMVPVEEFNSCSSRHNGVQARCRPCEIYLNSSSKIRDNGPLNKICFRIAGSSSAYYKLPKEDRASVREAARRGMKVESTTTRHKSEFGQSTPMTKRETTVVEGEQVPEGWVYVVYNPDVPSVLKIGKTFPDGIPSIMSSARRFGRAELADKFWFDRAYKAEQAVHAALSSCNLRTLGYADCGVELFKCNIEEVRGVIENERTVL
jgi:hypothetical protein